MSIHYTYNHSTYCYDRACQLDILILLSRSQSGFVFLARSCPSTGTESDIEEDGNPLWELSTGVSLLSRGWLGVPYSDEEQPGFLVREGKTKRAWPWMRGRVLVFFGRRRTG